MRRFLISFVLAATAVGFSVISTAANGWPSCC